MNLNDLLGILESNDYKITEQRKAILQVLAINNENLISVESLIQKSKELYQKTNSSTVYRNLEVLENLNLVHKVIPENGITLYKLLCHDEHHHHIICKQCGKTDVIDFCPMNAFRKLSKDKNFDLTDHKLELYGYCSKCQNTKDKKDTI